MKNACEGVLYPKDAMSAVKETLAKSARPHMADCKAETPNERKNQNEQNHKCERSPQGKRLDEGPITVPHKAWVKCKDELDGIFRELAATAAGGQKGTPAPRPEPTSEEPTLSKDAKGIAPTQTPKRIFVLAPLHKGPIVGQPFSVYTPHSGTLSGTDWSIELETPGEILELGFVDENDDICTEEHSLEIIAPYLASIYPNTPVCYLLAPCEDGKICELKQTIGHFRTDSLIFVSDDDITHCASMWR